MRHALTLSRAPVIPRDPNITVRMKRLPAAIAAAAVIATSTPVQSCPPGDFFLANFDGDAGITLIDYVPDIGVKFDDAPVNLDDSGQYYRDSDLSMVLLDGTGAAILDPALVAPAYHAFSLKPNPQPVQADYFVEVAIARMTPDDFITGLIAVRATPMTVGAWPDAVNYVGLQFYAYNETGSSGLVQVQDYSASDGSYSSAGDSANATYSNTIGDTIGLTFRIEVKGMHRTHKLNGMTIFEEDMTNPQYADGEIFIVLVFERDAFGNTPAKVTHIRAGYL